METETQHHEFMTQRFQIESPLIKGIDEGPKMTGPYCLRDEKEFLMGKGTESSSWPLNFLQLS